jgi:hypothetical protein
MATSDFKQMDDDSGGFANYTMALFGSAGPSQWK